MNIKRIFVLFSFSAVLALSSCGKTACKPVGLDENMKFHGDIVQDEVTYSADFERAGDVGWKAVFTAPETVEGMEVNLFNETCTINFKELSYTADRSELPQYGMVSLITSALDDCISGKVKSEKSGSKTTEKGTVEDLDFTVDFKGNTPTSINISDVITAEFE